MARCLISFGANIGNSAETISQAVDHLQTYLRGGLQSFQLSRLFRTPAVGGPAGQPPFINAVAAIEISHLSAWDVWRAVRNVEQALGRVRIERWEARRIDLDVLLFEDEVIWTQHFKLPHPRMVMRRFILEPALDVAAQWREPVCGMTIAQLAARLRHGPASIALLANSPTQVRSILERAAGKSGSAWLMPRIIPRETATSLQSTNPNEVADAPLETGAKELESIDRAAEGRWLGALSLETLRSANFAILQPSPKLVFVLADAVQAVGAAWEDVHRPLANWLGLARTEQSCAELDHNKQDCRSWPLPGPRYLLSGDDESWAEHEIVSAMEAMDCPVEVAN